MPGLVVSVSARTGDVVAAGQALAVLEAMTDAESRARDPGRARRPRVRDGGRTGRGGAAIVEIADADSQEG